MRGELLLLDGTARPQKGQRIGLAESKGKDEAWLRDVLFENPDVIPIDEIDSAFGPLIPLRKELRIDTGRIDAVFINEQGRLTILECKLWRNPEARKKVVGQAVDYVSALAKLSYSDLEREVRAAGNASNSLFKLVQKHASAKIREQHFVDSVSRSLRDGQLLVLIAGDGIRERVELLTDFLNRHTSRRFSFGLIEVAIYRFGGNRVAVQPRVAAKTEIIPRYVTVVNVEGQAQSPIVVDEVDGELEGRREGSEKDKGHLRAWWRPVLEMKLDDPEQERPFWLTTNNVVLNTPFPGIQIKAYSLKDRNQIGVFLSGTRRENTLLLEKLIRRERKSLSSALPPGTDIRSGDRWPIAVFNFDLESDGDKRAWIIDTLNRFVNVLSPRLRKWHEESC